MSQTLAGTGFGVADGYILTLSRLIQMDHVRRL